MVPPELDIESLEFFDGLTEREQARVRRRLQLQTLDDGDELLTAHRDWEDLYLVLDGQAGFVRHGRPLALLRRGDCVGRVKDPGSYRGEWAVRAIGRLQIARLSADDVTELATTHPHAAYKLLRNVAATMGRLFGDTVRTMSMLLKGVPRPLQTSVEAILPDGAHRRVRAGTELRSILPSQVDGAAVVAATLYGEYVSLNRPLLTSGAVVPITENSTLGRRTYRRSVCMLLLEAATRLRPGRRDIYIGPSIGFAYLVESGEATNGELQVLADALLAKMRALVEQDVPFRLERWTVDEARAQFDEQGWTGSTRALDTWRNFTVPLVSCGEIYALEETPLVPSTGHLRSFDLVADGEDLLLYFGDSDVALAAPSRRGPPHRLAKEHEGWLQSLGAVNVGAFNELCINRRIERFIKVSEGSHEKRIGQIADAIAKRGRGARLICISGPSSSGKTTFIRRLGVQLQVNGIGSRCLGLDDYYVDRERSVRGPDGEYDFEALETLDLALLGEHLARMLAGERVRTAHYDFKAGRSHPEGGAEIELRDGDVLMLEGIHALNPGIPVAGDSETAFRVFINPMTSLPIDPIAHVGASDVRLLRRIVRDRRGRAITAADNIARWGSVRRGEKIHIFPHAGRAHDVFNSSLVYEPAVLKVYAERYLLEVPREHPSFALARRLRRLLDLFVSVDPDHVPPNSLLREFIGEAS